MESSKQLLKYLNLARSNPLHYYKLVDQQMQSFQNQIELAITPNILYETNQGKKAWIEAKSFLSIQLPIQPLSIHQGLTLAARDHANDMSLHNIFGHCGSDNSSFSERVQRYCKKGVGSMVQIIGVDYLISNRNTAQMTVLGLIIADGVKDRGHRNAIFNPQYKYVGMATGIQQERILSVFALCEANLQLKKNHRNSYKLSNQKPSNKHTQSIQPNISEQNYQKENKLNHQPKQKVSIQGVKDKIINSKINTQNIYQTSTNHYRIPTLTNINNSKSILQKTEKIKNIYENGYKISQLKTTTKFTDGTIQENIERVTMYTNYTD